MLTRGRALPGGVVLFVGLNVANTSNYLYQVVMGRALGPSAYGLLGSVIALVNVVVVSLAALQTASAKAIASTAESPRAIAHPWNDPLTRATVLWGLAVSALFAVAAPLIALFLHAGIGPALVLAAAVVPSALLTVGQGRLQGLHALHAFAGLAVFVALARLILGPLAVAARTGVTGAGMAVVVAAALGAVWALHQTRRAGAIRVDAVRRDIGRGAIAFVAFWLMVSADIVIARHYLSAHVAGQYAVASVVGKAILWLPTAIAIAVYPRVARDRSAGAPTQSLLTRGLILTLALAVVGVAGLAVLGHSVIPAFFGAKYDLASTFAWQIGLACLPFALANLLVYYHLAADGFRLIGAIAVAAVGEGVALAFLHGSVGQIAGALGIGGAILCIGLLALALVRPAGSVVRQPAIPA